ncbi:hypothetical protein [Pectobacterium versatile]|uniref:hypothetical protein n=1 Tax=Pectobacterium versatile TaxID=2488639 RepID=UPI002B24222E|nr:hypothetical protein [Pectobacterium versatile]
MAEEIGVRLIRSDVDLIGFPYQQLESSSSFNPYLVSAVVFIITIIGMLILIRVIIYYKKYHTKKKNVKDNLIEVSYDSYENAGAIFRRVNAGFYQHLLAEFSRALKAEGYKLTRNRKESVMVPGGDLAKIAESFTRSRELYLAPYQKEPDLTSRVEDYLSSGYAIGWVMWMINASLSEGWYIAKIELCDV